MDNLAIQSYLRMGYFMDYKGDALPFESAGIDRTGYTDASPQELSQLARDKIMESIERDFRSNEDNVVPLSGGYDSRLILAALREFVPAQKIQTYTFGEPGSYDFKWGCHVAKIAGTNHLAIPMRSYVWNLDVLMANAQRSDGQGLLFYMHPTRLLERLFSGTTMWSGYAGDLVAGSKLLIAPSSSPLEAKMRYLEGRRFVRVRTLTNVSPQDLLPYVAEAFDDPERITYDEQIMISEALPKFTAQACFNPAFKTHTPQFNTPWADFFFSVPDKYRYGQNLMISSAIEHFPDLFRLPSKNTLGFPPGTGPWRTKMAFYGNRVRKLVRQWVPSVNWPAQQYYDYHECFRTEPDMKDLAYRLLNDLQKRDADLPNIAAIWADHQARRVNAGDAIVLLASLEACLKHRDNEAL